MPGTLRDVTQPQPPYGPPQHHHHHHAPKPRSGGVVLIVVLIAVAVSIPLICCGYFGIRAAIDQASTAAVTTR